jgi:hypothetical protein
MVHELNGKPKCTCKEFNTKTQCSHVKSYEALDEKIDLHEQMELINQPKSAGRLKKYKRVAKWSYHDNNERPNIPTEKPADLIGTNIATKL